ncbi:MAG: carboxymuconolactone decarboxylase family protein [Gammaproteobacteria bacterium]|nr:MAG: carboxymuconolactone decarboxylase family protein [Gammaproteobacteria bacterium]
MSDRIPQATVYQTQPAIAKALLGLAQAAIASGLEVSLIHLIKLRASQINGCAFCQHMHANEARHDGETQTRLDVLAAWHEVPIFTPRERAALGWTETLTLVAGKGVSEEEFKKVSAEFTQTEIINLTAAIVAINSWNRIAVGFNFIPKFD